MTSTPVGTARWTVAPGEWYAVLGDQVAVLLPPAGKARVAGIWERVDAGAGFDEVLDALISGGLRGLPAFVLACADDADVKVVVRGEGRAELRTTDGTETVAGSPDTTWVERSVSGVVGVRIEVAASEGAAYTTGNGLVRVSRVERPAAPATVATATPEPMSAPAVPPVRRPVARLVLPGGEVVDVDRPVVVGRAPEARRSGTGDGPRLVTVASPHQEISSAHVEIRPGTGDDEGSAVVTDLHSTNGTVVAQPGRPTQDLLPGLGVALAPGAVIDLGEGVTIEVRPV